MRFRRKAPRFTERRVALIARLTILVFKDVSSNFGGNEETRLGVFPTGGRIGDDDEEDEGASRKRRRRDARLSEIPRILLGTRLRNECSLAPVT